MSLSSDFHIETQPGVKPKQYFTHFCQLSLPTNLNYDTKQKIPMNTVSFNIYPKNTINKKTQSIFKTCRYPRAQFGLTAASLFEFFYSLPFYQYYSRFGIVSDLNDEQAKVMKSKRTNHFICHHLHAADQKIYQMFGPFSPFGSLLPQKIGIRPR